MEQKVLITASTYIHIRHFHLPYLREFQEKGWVVHVGCGGRPEELPWADEVIHLPFEKKMTAPANFRATAILREKMAEENYDLVVTHTSLAAFFTRLALLGKKKRPRVINMVHGYLFDEQSSWLKRTVLLAAERLTAPCTDLLLTMNRWDYDTARQHNLGTRVANVPGIGVHFSELEVFSAGDRALFRREAGVTEDDFVLFYAAEFSARKSQSVLIRAMTQLPEKALLVLAGEGTRLEECKTLARSLGVEKRVIFPGYVRDVGRWYAMADVAVSASRSEGLPFNIMEAMYGGLPVVASRVKGHEDLVTNGETGFLYPYGDHGTFAAAVRCLMEEPELRERMGDQGRRQVLPYGIDVVLPAVMAEYESVLPGVPEKISEPV